MPSDDLLSPSMYACTLDETGIPGYRPAALRLLEAHDAALREQVRVLREALEWTVECIADGDEETPRHDCGYITRPDTGYCEFHDRYWAARAALSATAQEEPK